MLKIDTGNIYTCLVKFQIRGQVQLKQRPVLIIGKADDGDYTALPISKIPNKQNVNENYDIQVPMNEFPNLNLTVDSYVRTNKIFTANRVEIYKFVSDVNVEYPDLHEKVITKFREYTSSIS